MKSVMINEGSGAEIIYPRLEVRGPWEVQYPACAVRRKTGDAGETNKTLDSSRRERGDGKFHSSARILPVNSDLGATMDTCHGGRAIHFACES